MNPYYKERKVKPLLRSGLSFGLSKEVKADFDDYIERTYPNLSFNQSMNHIILDLLNTRCLERKYFNIDVVGIFPIYEEYDKLQDFINCKYFASRDVYSINRNDLSLNTDSFVELKEWQYLNQSVQTTIGELYKVYNSDYFTDKLFDEPLNVTDFDLNEFVYVFENSLNINEGFYEIIHFKVNNFLDDFIDGIYKSHSNRKWHMGIGYYSSENGNRYFAYEWHFNNDMEFVMEHIDLISEDDFKGFIVNSSNEELKENFENLIAPVNEEKSLEERNKELEFINQSLQDDIMKRNELITYLNHENETLKTQNQILNNMIKENEHKVEQFDKFVEILERFEFSEVIDDEEDTQK